MAMRRIATSMIGKSPLRLSSSSSKSTLGIASPLINRQSRSSSVPCLQLDEKSLTQGITTSEELEKRIHGMKVRIVVDGGKLWCTRLYLLLNHNCNILYINGGRLYSLVLAHEFFLSLFVSYSHLCS